MACITLSTDLGYLDPSVGVVKGILLQHAPTTPVIDLTHALHADQYPGAAYAIERSYRHFPAGTTHLILYDIFSERSPRMLYAAHEGYHFLVPDNGLLPLVFRREVPECQVCYQPEPPVRFQSWMHTAAAFCRRLAAGEAPFPQAPETVAARMKVLPSYPEGMVPSVDCTVIYIDHFGNVVLDITRQQFERVCGGRPFRISFRGIEELSAFSDNYAAVGRSEKLCRFNHAGYLEIAIRNANASQLLGMKLYNREHLLYRHIKITFG